ncbi:uncharacterized protein [Coffea arabica]|uniref:Uncharacterized protein isoform X1 n=1 Tax=Coffea arabica TaxID=13443 RepID=A0A6P6VN00_COFAR|nr:SET and MYND domain-containing protein 4-like isoform X1 [Coffea arabica]
MEKLKALVPETLKRRILASTADDLLSTSSSLLDFFDPLPLFHRIVGELTDSESGLCSKDKKVALESKLKGNECFSRGDFPDAVQFYSKALRFAPAGVDEMGKDLVSVLYVNRAFAFYKMGLLVECLRDSSRALSNSPGYIKAWFRRGKANASLGNHEDALRDLTISMKLEFSLSGKRQIENEMKMILDRSKEKTSSLQKSGSLQTSDECRLDIPDEPCQIKLQCVSTTTKGRGLTTLADIPEASLVHEEDPYAAIILKHCRESHCHFCFNELPMDSLPCPSCLIPLYCSQLCQVQASGDKMYDTAIDGSFIYKFSDDLQKYMSDVVSVKFSSSCSKNFTEHGHECGGLHWPLVLPSEVVLAGRVLAKYIEQQRPSSLNLSLRGLWDLCHNYAQLPPESKLEFHVYSIVLMRCLQHSYGSEFAISGETIAQLVILLSQIRANSMAIVRMTSFDAIGSLRQHPKFSPAADASTISMKQMKVGQAVYLAGSMFNHSCQPNIHAYFVSRTLYVRATEYLARGSELELSYGPQVGQLDCKDRQQFLEDHYSFSCKCSGCSQLNLSDLVLNSYRCVKMNCYGVVLDSHVVEYENQKLHSFLGPPGMINSNLKVDKCRIDSISKIARYVLENNHLVKPGCCLNCGTERDLESLHSAINEADICFRGLQDAFASSEVPVNALQDALRSLDLLRRTIHPLNKRLAEMEDSLAQAFCLVGKLQTALDHCQKSIKILEKLYDPNHIAIGNELLKLASIQLSFEDSTASDTLNRVAAIFLRYYGSHANKIFPCLQLLKEEALRNQ